MKNIIKQESSYLTNVQPLQLSSKIKELAEALSQSNKEIKNIQNRNIFQKLFCNNIRDLANVIIEQGNIISGFLELIKGIIFFQIGNLSTLMELRDGLLKERDDIDEAGKSYIDLAISFIDEALKTTKFYNDKFVFVESKLSEIQKHLTEKAKIDEEQNKAIQSIERLIEDKNKIDDHQNNRLNNIQLEMEKLSESSKVHEKLIHDNEQNLSVLRDELNTILLYQSDFSKSTGKKLKISILFFILNMILTLINSVGIVFLISNL